MTFRADHDAALGRIDVLERELVQLIEENSRLRGHPSPYELPPRKLRVRDDLDAAIAHVEVLERQNGRLTDENEKLRAGATPPSAEPPRRKWRLNDEGDPEDTRLGRGLASIAVAVVVIATLIAMIFVAAAGGA
jgi:hypothetical protein